MVPRVARSGSSSTLFGKTKSNEGEKPSGRRKGLVSCPPIPRPISDKRDKKGEKKNFSQGVYFPFFSCLEEEPTLAELSPYFIEEIYEGNSWKYYLSVADR